MKTCKSIVVCGSVVAALGGPAWAQEGTGGAATAASEPQHSINVNPLAAFGGYYNLNYEFLAGSHGLVVEAGLARHKDSVSSSTSYGGAAGWRWHWRGQQNSGFIGVMVGFYGGSADARITDDTGTEMSFDISVKELDVLLNVGKRWQFDSGLNITARIGGGRAQRWFSTSSTDPDAQKAVQTVEDLVSFLPIALDGELSVGYSF